MSTAARALLDDVKARREAPLPAFGYSPFPDFDRTLQTLSGGDGGGFSFNFDPKLADEVEASGHLGEFDPDPIIPFTGSYVDAFPALQASSAISTPPLGPPPGSAYPANRSIYDPFANKPDFDTPAQRGYVGSFNPFADSSEDDIHTAASRIAVDVDEERKHSRFNFARGRQNSNLMVSPSSASGMGFHNPRGSPAFYGAVAGPSPNLQQQTWSPIGHQEYNYSQPASSVGSPLQQNVSQNAYTQSTPRFQPFEAELSEAQLREFIQSSRERANANNLHSNQQGT